MTSPYAAYALNEGSGTTIIDYSGNGRNMAISGSGNTWPAGHGSYAAAFLAGASAAGADWNNGSFDPVLSGDVTVMTWAQTSNGATTQSFAAGLFGTPSFARLSIYSFRSLTVAASPQVTIRNSSGSLFGFGVNGTSADASWHHFAVVYHATGLVDIYEDGTLVSGSNNAGSALGVQVQYLGVGSIVASGAQSAVQDFRVFAAALSQSDIVTWMNTPVVGPPPATAGLLMAGII